MAKLSVSYIKHGGMQKEMGRRDRKNKNPEENLQPVRRVNSLQDLIECCDFQSLRFCFFKPFQCGLRCLLIISLIPFKKNSFISFTGCKNHFDLNSIQKLRNQLSSSSSSTAFSSSRVLLSASGSRSSGRGL